MAFMIRNTLAAMGAAAILTAASAVPPQADSAKGFSMDEFLGFAVSDLRSAASETPKTLFQTNIGYDERIAISVDAVILHRHGDPAAGVIHDLQSWSAKGFAAQRMFFSDSDAGHHYTRGEFDGRKHMDEIERVRDGSPVLCGGDRPYMLPTPGWTRYLETLAKQGIDGGATAIYPEEPLAHVGTGYEDAFKPLYESEYKTPWKGSDESPDAFYKTARLKNKLYRQLEQDLGRYVEREARRQGKQVDFLVPIHSLYSNLAAGLVAPLGTSLDMQGHKGYIGQIWSGPVQWTLTQYSGHDASFFDGAYVLYDYFVNLVLDSPKVLYLLSDPVEDNPDRTWPQYEAWYKECVAAKLMFPEIERFEILPWPDRIFLPGRQTGGGSPGPGPYRATILSVAAVLQDIPRGRTAELSGGTAGIGMVVGDTAMWQRRPRNSQDGLLGLLFPLLRRGIPVASVPIERIQDQEYMKRYRLLILSYDDWKPEKESYHEGIAGWVRRGGVLIVFDGKDTFDEIDSFWKSKGFPTPQAHLLERLGVSGKDLDAFFAAVPSSPGSRVSTEGGPALSSTRASTSPGGAPAFFHRTVGEGHVVVSRLNPASFADAKKAAGDYLPLVRQCAKDYLGSELKEPERIVARRGPYLIAHAFGKPGRLDGTFVDVFDSNLPIRNGVDLKPDGSAILVDAARLMSGDVPRVLHATHRLFGKREDRDRTTLFLAGPTGTDGAVRLYPAGKKLAAAEGRTRSGEAVTIQPTQDPDGSVLVRFPYHAEGVGVRVQWE